MTPGADRYRLDWDVKGAGASMPQLEDHLWPLDHLGLEKVMQMLASGGMPEQWMRQALHYLQRQKQAAYAFQGRTLN